MKKLLEFIIAGIIAFGISTMVYAENTNNDNIIYSLDFEKYDRSIFSKSGWDSVQGNSYTTYPDMNVSDGSTCFTMHTSNYAQGVLTPEGYLEGKGVYRLSFDVMRHGRNNLFYLRFGNSKCTAMNSANNSHMFETFRMGAANISYFTGTKGWTVSKNVVDWSEDIWYNISIWIDFDNKFIYYYVNDELLAKDVMADSFSDIRWIWFRYENTNYENYVSLDNIKLEKVNTAYAQKLSEQGVGVPKNLMFPVNVSIISENSGHIFRKEQTPVFNVSYTNQLEEEITFNADFDVINRKGENVFRMEKQINLKSGETLEHKLEIKVDKFDMYVLRTKYVNQANNVELNGDEIEFSWVNSPTPGIKNEKYGFNSLMAHGTKSQPEQLFPIIDLVGGGIQRDAGFGYKKNANGEFTLDTEAVYSKIDKFAKESGVKFLSQVGGNTVVPKEEEQLLMMEEAMEYFAREYKGSVFYWQFKNEVDFKRTDEMTCADYAKALGYFYRGVKKGNPDALVLGCTTSRANLEWIQGVLEAGGGEFMDVVTIQPYHGQGSPESVRWAEYILRVRDMMEECGYGHLELWVTEGNTSGGREYNTPMQHGFNLIRHFTTIEMTNCVDRFLQYSMQTATTDPYNNEHWFGIMNGWADDNPYAANPELLIACNYFEQTEKAVYKDSIVEDNIYIHRYEKPDGNNVLVMYSDFDSKRVSLNLGASSGELCDVYGNGVMLSGKEGVFTFTLTDAPVYFTYKGAEFENSDKGILIDNVNSELTVGSTAYYTLYNCADKKINLDYGDCLTAEVIKNGNDAVVSVTVNKIPDVFDFELQCNDYGTMINRDYVNVSVYDEDRTEAYLQLGVDYVSKSADITATIKPYNDNTTKYWQCIVSVKNNNSHKSISGEIDFLSPEIMSQNFEPVKVEDMKPGEEKVYKFNLPMPDTTTKNMYKGVLKLTSGESIDFYVGDVPRSSHYNQPGMINIKYISRRNSDIIIDGNIEAKEWGDFKVFSFGRDDISYGSSGSIVAGVVEEATKGSVEEYGGNSDFSGDMYAQWDENYLYVAAIVNDDYHYAKEAPVRFYLDDVFYVLTKHTENQRHDTRIDMALSEFMDLEPIMFCNWTPIMNQIGTGLIYLEEDGAQLNIKQDSGVIIYEARIPAELVSQAPFKKYLNIYASLNIRDYDVQKDKTVSWGGWTCLVD